MLEKALSHKGWKCHAGFSVTMPNNYVLLPGFDVDKKELEEKKLADAIPTLNQINASISRREELFLCHEGSIPFIKTRIINPLFNRFQMSPGNFYTTDACIGCKRCEKSCPVGNIMMMAESLFGGWIAPHAWHVIMFVRSMRCNMGKERKIKGSISILINLLAN